MCSPCVRCILSSLSTSSRFSLKAFRHWWVQCTRTSRHRDVKGLVQDGEDTNRQSRHGSQTRAPVLGRPTAAHGWAWPTRWASGRGTSVSLGRLPGGSTDGLSRRNEADSKEGENRLPGTERAAPAKVRGHKDWDTLGGMQMKIIIIIAGHFYWAPTGGQVLSRTLYMQPRIESSQQPCEIEVIVPFYRWEEWDTGRLRNWILTTQLIGIRAENATGKGSMSQIMKNLKNRTVWTSSYKTESHVRVWSQSHGQRMNWAELRHSPSPQPVTSSTISFKHHDQTTEADSQLVLCYRWGHEWPCQPWRVVETESKLRGIWHQRPAVPIIGQRRE